MNDRRFKELVNLHLDHRLSGEEAKELEQALHADPARRRTLASYAVMQRGCDVLYRRSAAGAPAPQAILRAIRDAERKAGTPARPVARAWAWGTWSTAAGLAAMAAVMIVRVERPAGFAEAEPAAASTTILMASATEAPPLVGTSITAGDMAPAPRAPALPAHLTLAAFGIAPENREVGAVSNWSYPLNDITQAEMDRAASWARAATRSEWTAGANETARFSSGWTSRESATRANTVSFTFER